MSELNCNGSRRPGKATLSQPPQAIDLDVAGVPEAAFTERILPVIDIDDSAEET
jgi:hypothetical protein